MANPVDLASRVSFLPVDGEYRPWDFRPSQVERGPGVADLNSFQVRQRQTGAGMAVDIGATGVGEMVAWIRGNTRDAQGVYRVDNIIRTSPTTSTFQGQITVDVPSNPTGNPRIDIVVLRVLDVDHQGGSVNKARVQVIQGTATSGATLNNRTGAAAVPADAILLADILVAAGAGSITTAAIRDRRQFPLDGAGLAASGEAGVIPRPVDGVHTTDYLVDTITGWQAIALMYLPRRVVGAQYATYMYRNWGTPLAGSWALAIHDASGRKIVSGSASFGGSANSGYQTSIGFSATTFEAGHYWFGFGYTRSSGSGIVRAVAAGRVPAQGLVKFNQYGGTTLPDLPSGYTYDAAGFEAANMGFVPLVKLHAS